MDREQWSGGCQCGAVRYALEETPGHTVEIVLARAHDTRELAFDPLCRPQQRLFHGFCGALRRFVLLVCHGLSPVMLL